MAEIKRTPEQYRAAVRSRKAELVAEGVRDFRKRLAAEFGVSPQRIGQLLAEKRAKRQRAQHRDIDAKQAGDWLENIVNHKEL